MICPRCQHSNGAESIACHACGEPFKASSHRPESEEPSTEGKSPLRRSQWIYIGIICALAAGGIGYRTLVNHHLEQTAALFIGLPALMGVILVLFPQPKSATGLILRAICLGLLLSGPLLGEGFICILFASPLFLFVGLIIGLIEDSRRKRIAKREKGGGLLRAVLPLPLLLMSLEGTTEQWSFPRAETVTVKRVIHASPETVAERLARSPRFEQTLPLILRAGFPVPTECRGEGLAINDERMIHFAGGEGRPGDLRLAVTESRPGFARFSVIKDTSHIAHWMDWRESEVSWSGNSDKTTTVCWTIRFDRRLDPAWYFGPAENAAVTAAADYLIISCTSP